MSTTSNHSSSSSMDSCVGMDIDMLERSSHPDDRISHPNDRISRPDDCVSHLASPIEPVLSGRLDHGQILALFQNKCGTCFERVADLDSLRCQGQFCTACFDSYVLYRINNRLWDVDGLRMPCPVCKEDEKLQINK